MEEGTHTGFDYSSHSEHFLKCDMCRKHCNMDYYESQLKTKPHNNNLIKLENIWLFCGMQAWRTVRMGSICRADINN